MTATDINSMEAAERQRLARKVRLALGRDDRWESPELDSIEAQITDGRVTPRTVMMVERVMR